MTSLPNDQLVRPGILEPSASAMAIERTLLDRLGIGASLLCAIHCIAAPFLLLLLPAAGAVWSHPAVHWILAVLVVPLALWVLINGYRKHGNKLTLYAAVAGTLLILAGLISPMLHAEPVVKFDVPTLMGAPAEVPAADVCTEPCCPTITHDTAAQTATIAMPPGGLLTLIGSVLLVLAHTSNLIACRCFSKKTSCKPSGCGCPA